MAELRIALYVDFLTALQSTMEQLRTARHTTSDVERPAAAEAAFDGFALGALRQRMYVLAPPHVRTAAEAAYQALRLGRDHVASTAAHDETRFRDVRRAVTSARDELQMHMRHDLGSAP